MKIHRVLSLSCARLRLIACVLLLPCTTRSAIAQTPTADNDAAAVRATLTAMWDAIESSDVERYASYVHPSFTQFGETDTYLASGKEREVRAMRDYLSRVSKVHTEMHQEEITVRGDVAWITYYWTDAGFAGTTRFTSRGKSTRIFVRENGRWLCIHGHYTAVP